jgi:alginate O-acetyltransferase complex protein AlgI
MHFNSLSFWIFFFMVFSMYWLGPKKAQNSILLIASYVFYGAWDWRFLSLILFSTIVDYTLAKKMNQRQSNRKVLLSISIFTNLGLLATFKYLGFFIDEFNLLLSSLGATSLIPTISIILPVGISFYTFQTMSYTIDVYRKVTQPIHNFIDFALYVSFFPQLVAGPIERSHRLLPQIVRPRKFAHVHFEEGLYYIVYGLFLKIVLADNMAVIANSVYSSPIDSLLSLDVLVGTYAFAFQIYGDFAGYSFIAIGIAKWLGINLMINFNSPYLAKTPSEFWQRWHISLSSWLKDYLYIPLGGNKGGHWYTIRNLIITMVLGGLWHGAGWTFLVWGLFHGIILVIYRVIKWILEETQPHQRKSRLLSLIQIGVMFHIILISWVFFRAETLGYALEMLNRLITHFSYSDQTIGMMWLLVFYVTPIFIYEIWNQKQKFNTFEERSTGSLAVFFNYCFFMILVFPAPSHQEFIYFQF